MTRAINISRGLTALVDDADYDAVVSAGPWCAQPHHQTTYALRKVRLPDGRRITQKLHGFLTGWPMVDHRSGDGLDNQRSNLRPATPAQNAANQPLYRNNTSGYKGVTWREDLRRWRAKIKAGGRQIHLGYFDRADDAARAYDAAAFELFGEFARPNFPAPEAISHG